MTIDGSIDRDAGERHRRELLADGYTRVPGVLPGELLRRLAAVTDRLLDMRAEVWRKHAPSQGSMESIAADPIFAELVTLPSALGALRAMGYADPTFTSGYVIGKPPHSPRLFWHYDWFSWEHPCSYQREPASVAFMYYLTDTNRHNGCLRAIPASHVTHNPLHELLVEPHSPALARCEKADDPAFGDRPDEVDVPASAGDLLIVDARLLHASHANESDRRRTVITLWYQPNYRSLPEAVQAQFAKNAQANQPPADWPAEALEKFAAISLVNRYRGSAEPCPRQLYRRAPANA